MSERTYTEVKPGPKLSFLNPKTLNESGITGTIVEGRYVGEVVNQFEGVDYKFELDNGDTVILNGCGSLKYKLSAIDPGSYLKIDYNGMQVIESGKMKGKKAHSFTVLSAEEA